MRVKAQQRIEQLYECYVADRDLFPRKYQPRVDQIGVKRMAGEYIAGMTDRYFESTFERITGTQVKPCGESTIHE